MHLGHLIGEQNGPLWFKLDLVSVLLGYAPFVLHWDARFILDGELLLRGNARVARREEDLLVVKRDCRTVTESLKQDLLHVCRRVVEEELGPKVIESRRLWVELEADECERLACDLADRRVRFECTCRILHDAVLDRGIARVIQLHGLVNALVRAAVGEAHFVAAQLDHGDERLRAWGE